MVVNQFGPSISPDQVEADMMAHLKLWIPTYLGQEERRTNRTAGSLIVASWTTKTKFETFPEEQIPMIVVISPGTVGDPWKQGKIWSARWLLRLTAICSAPTEDVTRELAHLYAAAIRDAVIQNPSINNNPSCEGVDWKGDNYNLVGASETRTLAASQVVFHIQYKNVVDGGQGPRVPQEVGPGKPPTDPGPWPTVKVGGAKVTITKTK